MENYPGGIDYFLEVKTSVFLDLVGYSVGETACVCLFDGEGGIFTGNDFLTAGFQFLSDGVEHQLPRKYLRQFLDWRLVQQVVYSRKGPEHALLG